MVLHAFQSVVSEDLQLKCAERGCKTLKMEVDTVDIRDRYTREAVQAANKENKETMSSLKDMGELQEAREQWKQWAAHRKSTWKKTDLECQACDQKGHFA